MGVLQQQHVGHLAQQQLEGGAVEPTSVGEQEVGEGAHLEGRGGGEEVGVTCSSTGVSVMMSWDTLASSLVTLPPSMVFQASQGT